MAAVNIEQVTIPLAYLEELIRESERLWAVRDFVENTEGSTYVDKSDLCAVLDIKPKKAEKE